ncbi:MAG: hypothetical protein WBP94_06825 [Rhodomicrobiaceae bacterium]
MTTIFHLGARLLRLLAAASLLLLAGGAASSAVEKHRPKPEERWLTYQNPRFGFSLYYPSALFGAGEPSENGSGLTFISADGHAKIVVFGAHNAENYSPTEYRRILLQEFGGYDRLAYSPKGQTWFVLSGFRGGNIYYQKVMFSCANKVISVFSMTYPTAEKAVYEAMIETMEDHFKPGRGADTPPGC